jgi:hypothetical protein
MADGWSAAPNKDQHLFSPTYGHIRDLAHPASLPFLAGNDESQRSFLRWQRLLVATIRQEDQAIAVGVGQLLSGQGSGGPLRGL